MKGIEKPPSKSWQVNFRIIRKEKFLLDEEVKERKATAEKLLSRTQFWIKSKYKKKRQQPRSNAIK